MSVTASHPAASAGPAHPAQLTFRYTRNPDGWITAQIVEFPEAISQGASEHEAYVNLIEAFHDLTHEPTLAERIAYATRARFDEVVDELEPIGRRALHAIVTVFHDLTRDRVH
jgi:hypothetical protein